MDFFEKKGSKRYFFEKKKQGRGILWANCRIFWGGRRRQLYQKFWSKDGILRKVITYGVLTSTLSACASRPPGPCLQHYGAPHREALPQPMLGCPRKLGSMVRKWVITPIYPIYRQVITHLRNHLLTSWDIQVEDDDFWELSLFLYFGWEKLILSTF